MVTILNMRPVPEPLEKRIDICLNGEDVSVDTNCYGTSLFLLGIIPYDVMIFNGRNFLGRVLDLMEEVSEPQDNSLIVSINRNSIHHIGYVETATPFVAYQRIGINGKFSRISSINGIDEYLSTLRESKMVSLAPLFGGSDSNKWIHRFYTLPELGLIKGFFHDRKLKKLSGDIVNSYRSDWEG